MSRVVASKHVEMRTRVLESRHERAPLAIGIGPEQRDRIRYAFGRTCCRSKRCGQRVKQRLCTGSLQRHYFFLARAASLKARV